MFIGYIVIALSYDGSRKAESAEQIFNAIPVVIDVIHPFFVVHTTKRLFICWIFFFLSNTWYVF